MLINRIVRTLLVLAIAAASSAIAQDYPTRSPSLIIPFAAGGPTDTLGRHLALAMAGPLKQQVVVENIVGAGGTISYGRVAKSKPDGYTVLLAHIGMSTAPALESMRIFEAAHRAARPLEPALLMIDDLQWVDERSLALCHYLVRAARDHDQPLTVFAAARSAG